MSPAPRAEVCTHGNRFSDHRAMLRTHHNRFSDPRAMLRTHHNRFSDPRAKLYTHRERSPAPRAEVFGRYISIPFTSWTVCGVSVGSRRRRSDARHAGVKLKSRKPRRPSGFLSSLYCSVPSGLSVHLALLHQLRDGLASSIVVFFIIHNSESSISQTVGRQN